MTTPLTLSPLRRLKMVAADLLLLAVAALIPALSHLLALPLYQLNPMMLVLLVAVLWQRNLLNSCLMALLLPSISALITGFPLPAKLLCMVPEYLAVVLLLHHVGRQPKLRALLPQAAAVLAALLLGKVVYYLLKALILAPAVLVTTSWSLQLATLLLFALGYALLKRQR